MKENNSTKMYRAGKRKNEGMVIPIPVLLQEAEDLLIWCRKDKVKLCKAGLNWKFVDELPRKISDLRISQSKWNNDYTYYKDCQTEWVLASGEGFKLLKELAHYLRFALRNHDAEYLKIQKFAKKTKSIDLIQNLYNLVEIGFAYKDELIAVGFDPCKLESAKSRALELSSLLAKSNSQLMDTNPQWEHRKHTFTELRRYMSEIRRFGKFTFWQNDDRYIGYTSPYIKKLNAGRRRLLADKILPTELPET